MAWVWKGFGLEFYKQSLILQKKKKEEEEEEKEEKEKKEKKGNIRSFCAFAVILFKLLSLWNYP